MAESLDPKRKTEETNDEISDRTEDKMQRDFGPEKKWTNGKSLRLEKQRKFDQKQAQKQGEQEKQRRREMWIERHQNFVTHIHAHDIQQLRSCSKKRRRITEKEETKHSSHEQLASHTSSLLEPYLDLKEGGNEKVGNGNFGVSSNQRLFIAEGTETVRVLIRQSAAASSRSLSSGVTPVRVVSILIKPNTLFDEPVRLLADIEKISLLPTKDDSGIDSITSGTTVLPANEDSVSGESAMSHQDLPTLEGTPPFHIIIGSEDSLSSIAGFHIARGAMACGVVPQLDETWLNDFFQKKESSSASTGKSGTRVLALDRISDTANLGSIIRCAAAFGVDVIVLSQDSCDAWYRRSVRCSMGYIFSVPIVRVANLASTLGDLNDRYGISSYAAVIDSDAMILSKMPNNSISRSWCCVMGNEGSGLSDAVSEACTFKIKIDMASHVDSLSVSVACGIILHGLNERQLD
eukprot:scaffold94607_cov56-Attheya_sp.AAC.11